MLKFGTMLNDTLTSLAKKPATEMYPFVRQDAPVQLRGSVKWDPAQCTGCNLCSKDCPAEAIQVIILDRKAKQFVMEYHVDRCTFCAQCEISCRQGSLDLSHDEWELAGLNRDGYVQLFGEPNDIQTVLENGGKPEN